MQRPTAVYQLCQILIKWMFASSVSVIWCLPRDPSSYIFAQVFGPCYLISYFLLPLLEQPCLLFLCAITCSTRYSFPFDSPLLGLLRGKKLCMVAGDYSPVRFSKCWRFQTSCSGSYSMHLPCALRFHCFFGGICGILWLGYRALILK